MHVDLNTRYLGAWSEINARLQARQLVLVAFAPLAIGGVTVALGISSDTRPDAAGWMAMLLPLLALSFALWTYHNDAIIGLLGAVCRECERQCDAGGHREPPLPAFHTPEQRWIVHGLGYRRLVDWGLALLFAVTLAPLFVVEPPSQLVAHGALHSILFAVSLAFGVGSIALVMYSRANRRKLQDEYAFLRSPRGSWCFAPFPRATATSDLGPPLPAPNKEDPPKATSEVPPST